MFKLSNINRKTTLFACCLVVLIAVVALTLSVKTNSQQRSVLNQKDKSDLLKQVENSTERPFKVAGNDDSPFRIVHATVKEISGSEFTRLTGKTTDLVTVSSVPEVKLTNISGKTITEFIMVIRNPETQSTRVVVQNKVSIAPGGDYTFKREHFVKPEKETVADKDGVRQKFAQPKLDSEKYWLQYPMQSGIFATVGKVTFEDGSSWMIQEGGEIR